MAIGIMIYDDDDAGEMRAEEWNYRIRVMRSCEKMKRKTLSVFTSSRISEWRLSGSIVHQDEDVQGLLFVCFLILGLLKKIRINTLEQT